MRGLLFGGLVAFLAACSPIQHQETVRQPVGRELVAGVGDVVLRIDRSRDLENIFGRADLYGRKTNEGFSEVRFLGVTKEGKAAFARQDVAIHSNETTMSRQGGIFIPNTVNTTTTTTGTVGTIPVSGYSRTTGVAGGTVIPAAPAETFVLPPNSYLIEVDTNRERSFAVSGNIVEIISASSAQLIYRVRQAAGQQR